MFSPFLRSGRPCVAALSVFFLALVAGCGSGGGSAVIEASPAPDAPTDYTVARLGRAQNANTFPLALNNTGQIVGRRDGSDLTNGFLYSENRFVDLGANTPARSLNDAGSVVGSFSSGGKRRAYRYTDDMFHDLGTLGGTFSDAYAINAAGLVVGTSEIAGGAAQHAFLCEGDVMVDLGVLLGYTDSFALGVSGDGQVVGYCSETTGKERAFWYREGVMRTLGGFRSRALAINRHEQIVGKEYYGEVPHAVLFDIPKGKTTVLGDLEQSSAANAINDAGQVVGVFQTADRTSHAFLWENGVLYDLNLYNPLAGGSEAVGINDNGQILLNVTAPNGFHEIVLLTPRAR